MRVLRLFLPILALGLPRLANATDIYIYGGPGSLEGTFQTVAGDPDRQGWIGVDLSIDTETHWHVDTYNADTTPCLQPGAVPNHAWWCGDDYPSCEPGDPDGGYGNDYEEYLDWWGEVDPGDFDSGQDVNVTLTARLSFDNEPGYDYLYLMYEDDVGGMTNFATPGVYNGKQICIDVAENQNGVTPLDRFGHPGRWVHLRWRFVSDGAWSDEDCDWPTEGAAQIDSIAVYFDQGGAPLLIGAVETCEEGHPLQWDAGYRDGVGDFSHVWPLLDDLDAAWQNDTPQFAFIDDGVVVPGTGGSPGVNWTYGPGGYTIYMHSLEFWANEIWSPPIALVTPAKAIEAVALEYDVYHHKGMCQIQGDRWRVRSREMGGAWSAWQDPDGWIMKDPEYERNSRDILPYLLPYATEIQIALGCGFAIVPVWCWAFTGQTPAPYFDNVAVYVVPDLASTPDLQVTLWLAEPAPNPFNPATSIEFYLPEPGPVTLAVYDLKGRLVRRLLDGQRPRGPHTEIWNGRNDRGAPAAAGTYIFRLEFSGETLTRKGSLLK
jgi:hypothetical protein